MAHYGGFNFTDVQNVNFRGTGGNPGVLRSKTNGFATTVSFGSTTYLDQAFAVNFPNKSGTMPIMGTFVVQIPLNSGLVNAASTLVTVAGIRAEDALVVQFNKGVSAGYNLINTAYTLLSAAPGNGNILLTIMNGGGGTAYLEQICSYLAMR